MKLAGQPLTTDYTRQVAWPRPDGSAVMLRLRPLPLGFPRRLREHGIVPPLKPTRVARDSAGKPLRDAQGMALLVADEGDAAYRSQVELYHQRVAVAMAAESLAGDPQVSFETPWPPGENDWSAVADRLHVELEQSGFTAGDLVWLCDEIGKLSNLWPEHLQATRANFFSGAPAGSD